ncbi:armadillo-type protein [Mycena olivaceomarginata]|nr:armadillo-type protein [Mycena olivaceomarginata]
MTRKWACQLTGHLARHGSTAPAILKLNISVPLVSLLGDEDSLAYQAAYTLSQIAQWEDGAKAVVDAKALDHVLPLLESPNQEIQRWTCTLTGDLARHGSTAPAILKLNIPVLLVSLLGDEDSLAYQAAYTLTQIAQWEDGAKAVVDAKALDHVLPLLKSPNQEIRRWTCTLTGDLARHGSTAPAILKLNISVLLVSLLDDEDSLAYQAAYTLTQIAQWEDGTKAVVDAKVLDYVLPLLESPNPMTRKWACQLTGHLARHGSTAPAILKLNISVPLVSLLGDEDSVAYRAAYALTQIARWEDGAKAVVDAKALDYVSPLLKSPNQETRRWTYALTGHLAHHRSTAPAILQPNHCEQIMSLLE